MVVKRHLMSYTVMEYLMIVLSHHIHKDSCVDPTKPKDLFAQMVRLFISYDGGMQFV